MMVAGPKYRRNALPCIWLGVNLFGFLLTAILFMAFVWFVVAFYPSKCYNVLYEG
jgi:hypothetical protein